MASTDDEFRERFDAIGDEPRAHLFSAELLSTMPDHELQELVKTAARIAGTPIALVTMLTDHLQLFRAHTGLPDDGRLALATDRDISFCQNVVAQDAPFETHDAARDPRVPQHLVETEGLAAYYGVPLRSQRGTLGSLCVIDLEPRDFTDTQRAELARLGALVERRLEQLRVARRMTQSTEPIFAELRNLLTPMMMSIDTLDVSLAEVTALQLINAAERTPITSDQNIRRRNTNALLELADEVRILTEQFDALITNIDALQDATCETGASCRLERVLPTVRTLTHHLTKVAGGLTIEAPQEDAELAIPMTEVTTTLCVAVNAGAKRMLDASSSGHVTLSVTLDPTRTLAHFELHSPAYDDEDILAVRHDVLEILPSNVWRVSIPTPRVLRMSVPTLNTRAALAGP